LRSGIVAALGAITLQAGQHRFVDFYHRPRSERSWMDWLATWTPLKRMEEAEYEKILTGKIDAINDQISSLDERLEKMRQEKEALLKPDS
jgi:hypothetical protein